MTLSCFIHDDQIYTFDAESYGSIDVDITEVPYSLWSNYWNFTPTQVCFYGSNHSDEPIFEHRIGIQVYYTVGNVKNASDIVWLYNDHNQSSVSETVTGKTVKSVRHYNVAGQQVTQPQGLTIQVTTYTDGSTSVAKVIK